MKLIIENIKELILRTNYKYKKEHQEYREQELNTLYNYFSFLEDMETMILKTTDESPETVLYSKYFWYTKYKEKYTALNGKDAGIEQQQFKIIEEIEQKCNQIDWNLIQEIEEITCTP